MSDPEVPEADALEQAEAVEPDGAGDAGAPAPTVGFEVPAADALEQAVDVGGDDDHDHDR